MENLVKRFDDNICHVISYTDIWTHLFLANMVTLEGSLKKVLDLSLSHML